MILFLSLAILVGQMQFAYTSYYCTVKHAVVKEPMVETAQSGMKPGQKVCDQCRGIEILYHGAGVSMPSCLRVERHKKDVTDSFVDAGSVQPNVISTAAILPGSQVSLLLATETPGPLPRSASPPELTHPFSTNLRI